MALVLEIKKNRGFYVDDTLVTVEEIYSPSRFKVLVHKTMPTLMELGNRTMTEILPGVYAQAGRDQPEQCDGQSCKIAIEAPQKIRILRDNLYEKGKPEDT